jgi:hypothetical protein
MQAGLMGGGDAMFRAIIAALAILLADPGARAQSASHNDSIDRNMERRAVEAVIWGMPVVNFDLMYQAMALQAKGSFNQIVYWSRLPDWKNQTLTPNPDAIYLMPFIDTAEVGPVVVEIPPADDGVINGTIMNAWQMPLDDVGPAGTDKGKGAKYLVLPPDYKDKVPGGYVMLPSETFRGYALLRSILKSGSSEDIAKAVAYAHRVKVYPLAQAASPPPTTFVDAIDVVFDATMRYDWRFFQSLANFVQYEPWLTRDKAMIDQLKSIGIEKGRPFAPDKAAQAILTAGAREAHELLESRYESVFVPFFKSSRWALPVPQDYSKAVHAGFGEPDNYPIDSRGLVFSFAFFSPKNLGTGQFYLMTIKDKLGNDFDGGSTYRLMVPPDAPVTQYWSATVYDRATHALIRNVSRPSRSSQSQGLLANADGSVNIYFGPTAPEGQEPNWIPTVSGGRFEVLFRLYGPQKPLFDKTWVLPDIERFAAE